MELTSIRTLFRERDSVDHSCVRVGGWVRSIRASKSFGFITLSDGTFFEPVQIVYDDSLPNFAEISKFNVGSAVIAEGELIETPEAKQAFEIRASSVVLEGASTPDYPLQKKRHSIEYLRTIAHLRPRTNLFQAVFRVTTLDLENVPKTEDGKVDFSEDFFGKSTNLTVSGQLNGETYAMAFKNIYTFGPTFRAENSNTTRHAAEFWMIEPEIAFAELDDDMQLAEDTLSRYSASGEVPR